MTGPAHHHPDPVHPGPVTATARALTLGVDAHDVFPGVTGARTVRPTKRQAPSGGRAAGRGPRHNGPGERRAGARQGATAPLETTSDVRTSALRYRLRRELWERMPPGEHRVSECGRRPAPASSVVLRRAQGGPAHWAGLATCGSISACPCCSAKIRAGRAEEIRRAVEIHTARGGGALFVTLTLPHTRAQGLVQVWDTLTAAFDGVIRGRHRQALRDDFGVVGMIRATEVTHGKHGWHPHVHLLLLVDEPWSDADRVVELWRWLHKRWARRVVALGGREPTLARGVQVLPCWADTTAVSRYLASVSGDISTELASADTKTARGPGSRSPFGLLVDAVEHDDQVAWHLYLEWVAGSKGRRLIFWSRGLKEHLGMGERTDEDIAAERDPAEVIAIVERRTWLAMVHHRLTVEVTIAVDQHGVHALPAILAGWGLPVWLDHRTGTGPPVIRLRRKGFR